MTEQELQLQYMLLENKYRLLEQSVAGMELRDSLSCELGLIERVNTTAISLFLLRKDRERLAESLGLKVADYVSLKSLGEQALEEILYKNADVITEFRRCLGLGEPSVEKSAKTEDTQEVQRVEKSEDTQGVENTNRPEIIKEVETAKEVEAAKPMKVARNTESDRDTEVKVQTGRKRGPKKKEAVLLVEAKSKSVEVATGSGDEMVADVEDEAGNALRGTEFTKESLQAAMELWG